MASKQFNVTAQRVTKIDNGGTVSAQMPAFSLHAENDTEAKALAKLHLVYRFGGDAHYEICVVEV